VTGRLQRLLGRTRPRIRRVAAIGILGIAVFAAMVPLVGWELAALIGWDIAGSLFLYVTWRLIIGADAAETERVATLEDETRRMSALIIGGASVASLVAVVFNLVEAADADGFDRVSSVAGALTTVVVSWLVLHTLYTLRYADLHYREGRGVDFAGSADGERPDYRDFAYLSFTIGMCYQVSDQALRTRGLRRTVLLHSLLSYVFGVVIIASGINVIAGLVGN